MCSFPSQSSVGRQILAACPLDSECEILGRVENDRSAGDWSPIITRVYKVQLLQDVPTNASGKETISQLGWPAVSQAGVARQPWSVGGSPYGVPLAQWDPDEFGLLRARIADCAKQSGADVRGLLAYVQHLETTTRSQNSAADPARRRAAADEAHRRSWGFIARCKEKLALLAIAERQAEEARQAEASVKKLPDLLRELDEMPANMARGHVNKRRTLTPPQAGESIP